MAVVPAGTRDGVRREILEAICALLARSSGDTFTPAQVVAEMAHRGTGYAESTIRTMVTSHMCCNAPDNAATTYDDLERANRGVYRLVYHDRADDQPSVGPDEVVAVDDGEAKFPECLLDLVTPFRRIDELEVAPSLRGHRVAAALSLPEPDSHLARRPGVGVQIKVCLGRIGVFGDGRVERRVTVHGERLIVAVSTVPGTGRVSLGRSGMTVRWWRPPWRSFRDPTLQVPDEATQTRESSRLAPALIIASES